MAWRGCQTLKPTSWAGCSPNEKEAVQQRGHPPEADLRRNSIQLAVPRHESFETFIAMHTSPVQAGSRQEFGLLLDDDPTPSFYEVAIG